MYLASLQISCRRWVGANGGGSEDELQMSCHAKEPLAYLSHVILSALCQAWEDHPQGKNQVSHKKKDTRQTRPVACSVKGVSQNPHQTERGPGLYLASFLAPRGLGITTFWVFFSVD